MIILPQDDMGSKIGRSLGTGLENALNQFSQFRMNNILQRQQALRNEIGLKSVPGMTPEAAKAYSNLDPATLSQVIKETMAIPHRQAFAQAIADMSGQENQQSMVPGLNSQNAVTPLGVNQSGTILPQLTERETEKLVDWGFKNRKEAREAKQFAYTHTAKDRKDLLKYKRNADEDIARLNKLEILSKNNKLPNDMVYKFLDSVGMSDVGSLIGKDAQEFNKIVTDFTSKAKDRYGTRISNFELGTFLRGLPSLLQTPDGRLQVIKDLKLMAELPRKRFELMQQVIKENGGIPPLNMEEQIEERMEPFKESIFKKYSQYDSEIPKYNVVSRSTTKPKAADNNGVTFKFPNGKFYHSDGMRWRPVEVKGNQISFLPEEELM